MTCQMGKTRKHFPRRMPVGSTSQAANVVEAMEAGAAALLIDEDTSATNFMVRDELDAKSDSPGYGADYTIY